MLFCRSIVLETAEKLFDNDMIMTMYQHDRVFLALGCKGRALLELYKIQTSLVLQPHDIFNKYVRTRLRLKLAAISR